MKTFYEKLQDLQKSKAQSSTIAGGLLLMISSGIHIGYGILNPNIHKMPWSNELPSTIVMFVIVSWYMGSIVGFLSAPKFLYETFKKKTFYLLSNCIIVATSGVMIILPTSFYVVTFTRFFAGIAHGWTYVAVISHLSENSSDWRRGMIACANHLFLICGAILAGSISKSHYSGSGLDALRLCGIISCAISGFAIFMTLVVYRESVVTLIQEGQDMRAINALTFLRGEAFETLNIQEDFYELKAMIAEDTKISTGIFYEGNLRPLFITLLLKVAFVLSFNYPLNMIRLNVPLIEKTDDFFWYFFPRIVIGIIVLFTIESGRKFHMIASGVSTSIILITFGTLKIFIDTNSNVIDLIIILTYEFLSALGLGLTAHVYDAEAFRTPKKMKSIAFTSIFEQFFQILFVILAAQLNHDDIRQVFSVTLLITSGVFLLIITSYLYSALPETKNLSIRQTRNKFLKS